LPWFIPPESTECDLDISVGYELKSNGSAINRFRFSECFTKERLRTEFALFVLTVSALPRSVNSAERATAAAVITPTIVKIVTLECHAPMEVNAIPSSLHAYNSPQHHVFLRRRAFLLVWQRECFTQPRYAVGWNSMNTCVSISQHSDSVTLRCALAMACLRRCAGRWARERRNLVLTILPLIFVVPVFAQMTASNNDRGTLLSDTRPRRYLFGDWGGKRTALAEKGHYL